MSLFVYYRLIMQISFCQTFTIRDMGQPLHPAGQVTFTCHLPRDKFCKKYLSDPAIAVTIRLLGLCSSTGSTLYPYAGSEIAPSWSPMRLKILHWRPEFDNWSPVGDQLFRRDRQSYHCKIYVNFDFQKQQFQIKFRSSSQQLTFILTRLLQ